MTKRYGAQAKRKIKIETKRACKTRALPDLGLSVAEKLRTLTGILSQLFADDNFVTMLEAESLTAIPATLRPVFEEARHGHEI